MQTIFFVGLGHMGLPMAENLIKAGHRVLGFDIQAEAVRRLAASGGIPVDNLSQVAEAEVCITMLQTGEQVRDVCCGEMGLFKHLKPGSLYMDCSTIDLVNSREVTAQAIQQHRLDAIDAPVSGGVGGAQSGTLTFMVGGTAAGFERAYPILSLMGKNIIHAGDAGSGQIAKMCNNMILGVSMTIVSEAFILAEQLGLSAQKLFEIVNVASGQCWVMSRYVPAPGVLCNMPADQGYKPGFTAKMMLKDLRLSQQAAEQAGVRTPMGALATELYEQLNQSGAEQLDCSVIFRWLKEHMKT